MISDAIQLFFLRVFGVMGGGCGRELPFGVCSWLLCKGVDSSFSTMFYIGSKESSI